jgi:hypothetical protein
MYMNPGKMTKLLTYNSIGVNILIISQDVYMRMSKSKQVMYSIKFIMVLHCFDKDIHIYDILQNLSIQISASIANIFASTYMKSGTSSKFFIYIILFLRRKSHGLSAATPATLRRGDDINHHRIRLMRGRLFICASCAHQRHPA